MIRAIGLDPSTASFGVALTDGSTRTIKPRAGSKEPARRLNEIIGRLDAYLELHRPEIVMIEGYDLGPVKGRLAAVRLGEVGGVVRVRLFERGIPYVEIPPSQLKQYAVGNGGAKKDLLFEGAKACGADVTNTDESDAWWLYALAQHQYAPTAGEPLFRADELRQLRAEVRARISWPSIDRRT